MMPEPVVCLTCGHVGPWPAFYWRTPTSGIECPECGDTDHVVPVDD